LNPLKDLRTLAALVALMWRIRPEVFLGYTIKPVIWGLLAARIANVSRRVALVTGLGYTFTGVVSGKRALVQGMARRLYAHALKAANLIFFQNQDDKEDFARMGLLPTGVPVTIINGSGVDLTSFPVFPLPDGTLKFLLIARLLGDKGIREYAEAVASLKTKWPDVQFHLVGGLDPNPNGIPRHEVEKWVQDGYLVWHGALENVRPALADCHVYVLPSYREGTPRSVLEAMAMGRAIITSDAPGCRETVIEGGNGFLVPVKSVVALEQAMERFIKNPSLAEGMGRRSRQIAEEKYDVNKVNEQMLKAMGIK